MSRTFHHGERRIRVHGVRKDPPDLRRLARALIELAELQAEAEAEESHKRQTNTKRTPLRRKNEGSGDSDHGDAA
jgi:hypothetical protein